MKHIFVGLLFGLASFVAQADPADRFAAKTKEYQFDLTTSSATPQHILAASGANDFDSYRVMLTCSAASAIVTLTFQQTQAFATTITPPTSSTPQYTVSYPCGGAIEIVGAIPGAWVNGIVSSGTATLRIIGGVGI